MKKLATISIVLLFTILFVSSTQAAVSFSTGVDTMNYSITAWSIRTDWAGPWAGKTPTYFMFDYPNWNSRYTNTSGVTYTQAMSGTAVATDVFSQADLQAVATSGPGWATMSGSSSPISFWQHGGQFLRTSGGNNSSWADDTYWASNEYGNGSNVVTDFTATFTWDGIGNNYIEGKILADDWAKVYINGSLVYTTDSRAYDAVEIFSQSSILINGQNSLKVTVYDTGQSSPTAGPTALQLEIVPEPATICLLGLGALALLRKRRA